MMRVELLVAILSCLHGVISANEELGTRQDPDWWKKTIVYQIYPRSFQDSDGDGVGDLKGIQSRLDYIKQLGVDAIWLSPIYRSPFKDFGYDISDHKDIDPVFGTLQDFDELLEEIHRKDMFLIMDFIPNHTSDLHPWFIESQKGKDNAFSDFYCWEDGIVQDDGTVTPPNNWISIFAYSAWEWNEQRQQFYLHQFVKEQPDLNYRNPQVRQEMEDILRFWCERGVDGFRIDAIQTMFEVEDVSLNEPRSFSPDIKPGDHRYLAHPYTLDQPEIHEVVQGWRTNVFDSIDEKTGKHSFMVMEVYDPTQKESMKYYHSGADMPFNFNLINVNKTCGGQCFKDLVDLWMTNLPEGKYPNFVLGNHDNRRITTRKGALYTNALNVMLLLLPGTPTTYYGEELGLLDVQVSFEDTQDPFGKSLGPELLERNSRDPERAPMQWSDDKNAGFSSADKTWLPVHPDYHTRNVKEQYDDPNSPLNVYRAAVALRSQPAFQTNTLQYHVVDENIFSFIRADDGEISYLIALNLGDKSTSKEYATADVTTGQVRLTTRNFEDGVLTEGSTVDLSQPLLLTPGQGVVLELINDEQKSREEL